MGNEGGRTFSIRHSTLPILIFFLVLLVFGRTVVFDFVNWDDNRHLLENDALNPPTWSGLASLWTATYDKLYIPASYTLFAAEAWISGLFGSDDALRPSVFHAVSVLLHAACAMAVFALLRRLVRHAGAACVGALLFALHPLQVESVAWVSEQRGLLSALASFVALYLYLLAVETSSAGASKKPYIAGTLSLLVALLAKPSAVAVPLLAIVVDRWWLGRKWPEVARAAGPWCVLALVCALGAKWSQGNTELEFVTPLWARPLIAGDALSFYLGKLALPWHLAFDYGRQPARMLDYWMIYFEWVVPAIVIVASTLFLARRVAIVGWSWFIAGLLPVLGFIPFLFQDTSTVADRYVYVPLAGVALGAAACLAEVWSRRAIIGNALVLTVLGVLSFLQCGVWRNSATLFEQGLRVNPLSYVSHYNLGGLLQQAGRTAEAEACFRHVIELKPNYHWAYNGLGGVLAATNQPAAIAAYRTALELRPDYVEARVNLANALSIAGERDAATDEYREALRIAPQSAAAHANYGLALIEGQHLARGLDELRTAITLRPRWAEAHFMLGQAELRQQHDEAALVAFRAALRFRPTWVEAHNNVGGLLLQQGDLNAAEAEFDRALKLRPTSIDALVNKGLTLVARGRHADGAVYLRKALALLPMDSPQSQALRNQLKQIE